MTRWVLVVIIGAIAGCVLSSPPRPSAMLLVQADRLVTDGEYAGALEAYEEILAKYPDTDEAGRARSSRETLANLLAARAHITRLTAEMKTQETQLKTQEAQLQAQEAQLQAQDAQLKAQDADLTRAREQVAAREGELARARQEIARLTAEADRLRTDLENLKKIDIDLERRRK